MRANHGQAFDQAISWHLKASSMGEDQWLEFIRWLERSPENRFEYDRVAKADSLVALTPPNSMQPEPIDLDKPSSQRRFGSWARRAAALFVVALASWNLLPSPQQPEVEQTEAGTVKQIEFAGGTRINLNGETRLLVDQTNPRSAKLQAGEVLISVRQSEKPFVVEAGGFKIQDLGTVFNVRLSDESLEIGVKEGKVLFDPGGLNLTVNAGEGILVDRTRNVVVKSPNVASGSWLDGELAFDDSNLAAVVAAMRRRSGIDIRLSPALSKTPFTGNIKLSRDESVDAAHLARLIGANYRREGDVWVFTPRGLPR